MAQVDVGEIIKLANSLIEMVLKIMTLAQQAGATDLQLEALDAKLTAAINRRAAELDG